MGPDGLITRERAERYVQLLAEGLEQNEAWRTIGGDEGGGGRRDRNGILADPVFQARREMLTKEREMLEAQGPHGEAMWCAKQTFRAAQLAGDLQTQMRAATAIAQIADKLDPVGPGGGGAAAGGETAARGPGRPASETKQSKPNIERMTQDLIRMGVSSGEDLEMPEDKPPAPAEEEGLPL